MRNLIKLIDTISEFGTNPNVNLDDKTTVLKNTLIGIYSEFLNLKIEFDEKEYANAPKIGYDEIYKNVKSNFPNFTWYSTILDMSKMAPDVKMGTGDALDDLTDIILDLLNVRWRMENTSQIDAIWHFDFLMKAHSEIHLIDLLKFIKENE